MLITLSKIQRLALGFNVRKVVSYQLLVLEGFDAHQISLLTANLERIKGDSHASIQP